MSQPTTRYPLATPDGNFIPADVLKSLGTIRKDFLATPGTAVDSLPAGTEIIQVTSTVLCHIRFANSVAIVPVHAGASVMVANQVRILANVPTLIAVPSTFYSVIGEAATGTLWINVMTKWNVLALDIQFQRT